MFVTVCQGVLETLLRKVWPGMLCRSWERFRHASVRAREAAHILIGSTKVVKEQATVMLGDDEPHAGVGQQQGGQALY